MDYTVEFDEKQFNLIERILDNEVINLGVQNVLLIDVAGNILISLDNGETNFDVYSLAALAAGNFGTVSAMAEIVGEQEFSLLFHKGETECLHFSKVSEDLILITIFGKEVSLGFLRLKVAEAIKQIQAIIS